MSPSPQRHPVMGPIALFGRGRVLNLIMMATVSLFGYVTGMRLPHPEPENTASAGTRLTAHAGGSATSMPQVHPVQRHGGTVEDERAVALRRIGQRLASATQYGPPTGFRFYLLRDDHYRASYTLADGSILITAAEYYALGTEPQLAESLSRRMADFLYRGRTQNPDDVVAFRSQLLASAGYLSTAAPDWQLARQPGVTR